MLPGNPRHNLRRQGQTRRGGSRRQKLAREELAALRDQDRLSPDLGFRDPYLLDFLELKDIRLLYPQDDLPDRVAIIKPCVRSNA